MRTMWLVKAPDGGPAQAVLATSGCACTRSMFRHTWNDCASASIRG